MHAKRGWRLGRHFLTDNAWWALGSLWLAVVLWAFMNGPRLYAAQEQEIAIEAEAEDHSVCQRLNMPVGSGSYSACASELGEVRRHQTERLERHTGGIL